MSSESSVVITLRVPRELSTRLAREARRQRRTRGAVARDLLAQQLSAVEDDALALEARRQSLLVRKRRSEREALDLVVHIADARGWK